MQRGPKYGGNSSFLLISLLIPQRKQETVLSSSVRLGEELDALVQAPAEQAAKNTLQSYDRRCRKQPTDEKKGCDLSLVVASSVSVLARITIRRMVLTDVCTHSGYEKQFGIGKNHFKIFNILTKNSLLFW